MGGDDVVTCTSVAVGVVTTGSDPGLWGEGGVRIQQLLRPGLPFP